MKDYTNDIGLSEKLFNYLRGNINPEDKKEVEEWLKDKENKDFFEEFRKSSGNILWMEQRDVNAAWDKVSSKVGYKEVKSFRNYFWRIAAVVIVLIGFSGLIYMVTDNYMTEEKVAAQNGLKPGYNQAVLINSKGENIKLGKGTEKRLLSESGGKKVLLSKDSLFYSSNKEVKEQEELYNTLLVPRNGEFYLVLDDGTKVWVNSETKLKYPVSFGSKERVISLEGEAYFEVSKDKKRPFIINTTRGRVKVLGTQFNMSCYEGEEFTTTLVEGSVEVGNDDNSTVIKPGEQATVRGNLIDVKEVETIYYTAWKDGYFMFYKTPIDEILKYLSRWYDFEYFYQNESVKDLKLTARIKKYEDIESVLKLLSKTEMIKFRQKGKSITVLK